MKLKSLIPGRKLYRQYKQQSQATKAQKDKETQFEKEFHQFRSKVADDRHSVLWEDRYPCLDDRTEDTGFDRHYVYHTGWASHILAETRPEQQVDVGSSLFFVSNVSAFVPVAFYDYRPADLRLPGVTTHAGTLEDLPFENQSVDSLSCMHVVEHVGLGRYGDPIDPQGDLKAMSELQRVIAKDGSLLFVTPVGKPKVCFNAHRVYSFQQIIENFPELELHQFALVPDDPADGGLIVDADPAMVKEQNYGCGCFWFKRQ